MLRVRNTYSSSLKERLIDIITNREEGRFFSVLSEKDTSKNLEKAEIWTSVTRIFNEGKVVNGIATIFVPTEEFLSLVQ